MTPPTRATVLAATGEELDRLVTRHVFLVDDDKYLELTPRWVRDADLVNTRSKILSYVRQADLGPAFARELAQLVIPNNKAIRRAFSECQTGFTYSDAQLWAMLSAPPEAVCRAAVLACIGEA